MQDSPGLRRRRGLASRIDTHSSRAPTAPAWPPPLRAHYRDGANGAKTYKWPSPPARGCDRRHRPGLKQQACGACSCEGCKVWIQGAADWVPGGGRPLRGLQSTLLAASSWGGERCRSCLLMRHKSTRVAPPSPPSNLPGTHLLTPSSPSKGFNP